MTEQNTNKLARQTPVISLSHTQSGWRQKETKHAAT